MNPNIPGVESDEDIMLDIFTDIFNSFDFVRINPELDNSAVEKIQNSYSPKTKKFYQKWKKYYVEYCTEKNVIITEENSIINYFNHLIDTKNSLKVEFGPFTVH